MNQYFLFLFIIFLILTLFQFFPKKIRGKNNSLFLKTYFYIFFLISSMRAINVGNDTHEYFRIYEVIANSDLNLFYITRYEIGFVVLVKFLSTLSKIYNLS